MLIVLPSVAILKVKPKNGKFFETQVYLKVITDIAGTDVKVRCQYLPVMCYTCEQKYEHLVLSIFHCRISNKSNLEHLCFKF